MHIITLLIGYVIAINMKANKDLKAPKITADYSVECENIYTYYLEQESTISLEEDFDSEITEIDHISAADIQAMSPDSSIKFECSVVLKSGPIYTTNIQLPMGFIQTWTILHHDDFESRGSLVGWNVPHRAYCQLKQVKYGESDDVDHFLGPQCHQQQQILSKTFTMAPTHTHLKVTAELTVFGDWNGDSISVYVDGKLVWQKVFNGVGIDDILHPCPKLLALGVPVQFVCEHNAVEFILSVVSTQQRHPCDGSFGVDDLIVYYK